MASTVSRCKHSPATPFAGMRRQGFADDDHILFVCPDCGARHVEARCLADNQFARCRNQAMTGQRTCHWHRLRGRGDVSESRS